MIAEPRCFTRKCKYFIGVKNDGDETTERVVCKAFPDGIPEDIAYGDNDHFKLHKAQKGKNTITFEVDKRR